MDRRNSGWIVAGVVVLLVVVAIVVAVSGGPKPGHVKDEAMIAGVSAKTLAETPPTDLFADMDMVAPGGKPTRLNLTPAAIQGRYTWMDWTGGNDRFWDKVSQTTFGNFDLLKVISSYPGWTKFSRDNRFQYLGVINEPCFAKPTGPRQDRYGLWLDVRTCGSDPFEDEKLYPGVKIGARGTVVNGKLLPVGPSWGYATGVLGLRLFPNPDFDEKAAKRWDPVRYYTDPSYYNSKDLVRPYRVGMACAFCHVGPSPVNPPADPENPQYANLSGTVGAQYYWVDRIFSWRADEKNYLYQLFHTSRPGALDTSLVSTDYINNPRTMNAVYQLAPRLGLAKPYGRETLSDSNLQNAQLPGFFEKPRTVWTPHVLKDGADSVGALGALNRVYLNIGLFSEEWLLHFNAFLGGQTPTPIRISTARANSNYWNATELQTPGMAAYLLAASAPHHLADAPGGAGYLAKDTPAQVSHGGEVFAERCARCHSSKLPPVPKEANPSSCEGKDYLTCWSRYWAWSQTPAFKDQMKKLVADPTFLDGNFLSTDMRVPSSLMRTNLCSPLATNAIKGSIWDDFSSDTYKALPSVGTLDVIDPISGAVRHYPMPAGGRGYTRPASLVSLWSTGPYLQNNSMGPFNPSPSVDARMGVFDASIRQMLWPETRDHDVAGLKTPFRIDRLKQDAYLRLPAGYLPDIAQNSLGLLSTIAPDLFVNGAVQVPVRGATTAGSAKVTQVALDDPKAAPGDAIAFDTSTFVRGQPVAGAGLAAGSHVVSYDGASHTLVLDKAATATGAAKLSVRVPNAGVQIGPIPAGTPINLLAAIEVAPETHDLGDRVKHDWALVRLGLGVKGDVKRLRAAKTPADKARIQAELDERLLTMSKCPDYEVNRGHYFGTSLLPEEPGLSDADKNDLIAFLKRL